MEELARPAPTPPGGSGAGAARAEQAPSRPVRLLIPAIGVDTPLVGLGLQEDRTVEVPDDPRRAGWYRFGATPGDRGAAVVLGHVDSAAGPAVFARLSALRDGDLVEVELDTGRTATFAVRHVRTYPNAAFPAAQVYRSRRGRHTLNLVTCGGAYDRDAGGYQSNVVVYTRQVTPPTAASGISGPAAAPR